MVFFAMVAACANGQPTPRVVTWQRGRGSAYVVVDTGGRQAEVFVSGVRVSRSCRRSGRMLRCWVPDVRRERVRVVVKAEGAPVLRCAESRGRLVCCRGCGARELSRPDKGGR